MLRLQRMELFNDLREFPSRGSQAVLHVQDRACLLLARDQAVLEQPAQPLREHFGGDASDVAFQFARTIHAALQGADDGGGPFAADNVLEPLIRGAFFERKMFGGHVKENMGPFRPAVE